MPDLKLILGFGLVTGSAAAFLYVVVANWRAVLGALRSGGERRSLILLAGPVLLVALVLGLRTFAPLSGSTTLAVFLAGLLIDPAALPILAFVVYRRLRGSR